MPPNKKVMDITKYLISAKDKIVQFDKRLMSFITGTVSAMSIIDNPSFIQLFEGFRINVKSRKTAMNHLNNALINMLLNFKQQLKDVEYVSTTADVWSSKTRSFLGVTSHWIDPNFERKLAA
ncbi:unnamed protein product [Psylliodes chrysocephalus]|uniref:Uncharacterized protein n=1 Tax=Psylliodes chrysocephalus TaxID=3402493 RepID=A0A9P0CKE8_9CUCU|nr:unnamed protein product [Psylliodes chrysocephala]